MGNKKVWNICSKGITVIVMSALLFSQSGCSTNVSETARQKDASQYTKAVNDAVYDLLDFDDRQEFEFATKGLIAAPKALEIFNENGEVIWSQKAFEFVEDAEAPDSANPSLWRNTQLNHSYGLFEVVDGIYQVRGFDISNITFIRGEEGWIVFDPLSNIETAKAALDLINKELGTRPVTGVVISHTHGDHFGGIRGVVDETDVRSGKVPVIVPEGFEEHAVSENVYAGNAMLRRADYMYGKNLEPGILERLGVGLGLGMPGGAISYISPSVTVSKTGEELTVDGVKMVFQLTPGTEAPAEMNTWFPDKKALWMAENCTGTLHNLYTLRGAQVRDGNAWAFYIMESLKLYGSEAEVVFQSHNWPHWGKDVIATYFTNTAAMYKFINDQTLLYINQGYTSDEISNMLTLPEDLEKVWYTRQYYGTVAHDAKAVYQRFMGWYDANPVNLNPLTPTENAEKLVEYMGGVSNVLAKAREDFEKGEYQWVAKITNAVVFVDPQNRSARLLCADALEQLGYQAESGVWRAAYLTGAKELREGTPTSGISSTKSNDIVLALSPTMLFDYMGINLDSNAAQGLNMVMNVDVVGDDWYCLTIKSGVLLYQKGTQAKSPDITVSVPKQAVALLLTPDVLSNELVKIEGDKRLLETLYANMTEADPFFNIVEP